MRQLLSLLFSSPQPLTIRDLSVALAARIDDTQPTAVTATERARTYSQLIHRDLPRLEEAGILHRDAGLVVADRTPFADTHLAIRHVRDLELPSWAWDAIGALLGRPRRQDLVSIVYGRSPIGLEDLATLLSADGCHAAQPNGRDDSRYRLVLHHSTLPALEDVDLLQYDPNEQVARTHPRLSEFVERATVVREMCSIGDSR